MMLQDGSQREARPVLGFYGFISEPIETDLTCDVIKCIPAEVKVSAATFGLPQNNKQMALQ